MFSLIPPQIKIYLYLALIAGLLGIGFYGGYRFELSSKEALIAKYEAATLKAVNQALEEEKHQEALKEREAREAQANQQLIVSQTQDKLDEVTNLLRYAKSHCITNGIIRVLNASASGTTTKLPVAAGKPDDACTTTSTDTVLRVLIRNNGIARQNAQQLNDLEKSVRELLSPKTP